MKANKGFVKNSFLRDVKPSGSELCELSWTNGHSFFRSPKASRY